MMFWDVVVDLAASAVIDFWITIGDTMVGSPGVMTPDVEQKTDQKIKLAPRYKVLIHNDDVTPMDFVVYVLKQVFKKNLQDAMEIMITAHNTGIALVTVLSLEEAELRVEQSHSLARTQKFPLTFTYEPE